MNTDHEKIPNLISSAQIANVLHLLNRYFCEEGNGSGYVRYGRLSAQGIYAEGGDFLPWGRRVFLRKPNAYVYKIRRKTC